MENLLAAIKSVPSFRNTPDNMIIAMTAALAVICLFMLFLFVSFIFSGTSEEKKEKEKAHPTHKAIMDLKEALVEEMRGTSKQNMVMIWLTIAFILVTIIGTAVSLIGPSNLSSILLKNFKVEKPIGK